MEQYINKSDLITKIEKRQNILDLDNPLGRGGMVELECLKDTINTMEVKEVDLEKDAEFLTNVIIEKVWNWIDENFHESEIDTKYGESANCVISELGMCKSDIYEKFKNDMKEE